MNRKVWLTAILRKVSFFIQSPFLRFVMLYAAIIKEQVDIDFVHLEIA